jgi:hypothetical protein
VPAVLELELEPAPQPAISSAASIASATMARRQAGAGGDDMRVMCEAIARGARAMGFIAG